MARHFFWHREDVLLDSMSFEELILTVHSNEQKRDRATLERVFNELLEAKVKDAREAFDIYYDNIKGELKCGKK